MHVFGQLIRLAVWNLRNGWSADRKVGERMAAVRSDRRFWRSESALKELGEAYAEASPKQIWEVNEEAKSYRTHADEISFEASYEEILATQTVT